MRKLFLILAILITYNVNGQVANILSWTSSYLTLEPPGTRIQTNIPVGGEIDFRPVIMIDGYSSSDASIISLKLGWSVSDVNFANASATSGGGIAPRIVMRDEEGKVVIYLAQVDGSGIYRFNITGLYQTNSAFEVECYTEWTVSDVAFDFGRELDVIYHNEFNGDTRVNGGLIAAGASLGYANIGSASISGLSVSGSGGITGDLSVIGDAKLGQVYASRGIQIGGSTTSTNTTDGSALWLVTGKRGQNQAPNFIKNCVIDFSTEVGYTATTQPNTPDVIGRIKFSQENPTGNGNNGFDFYTNKNLNKSLFKIRNDGDICINTSNRPNPPSTEDVVLAVKGEVVARKVRITQTGWADYVFAPSYELRSLQSVEEYIKEHGHLPDVPSAKEVENDGVDIGATQATLLRKIEELTLYVIEQGKNYENLKLSMVEQKNQIEKLRQLISNKNK